MRALDMTGATSPKGDVLLSGNVHDTVPQGVERRGLERLREDVGVVVGRRDVRDGEALVLYHLA